MKKLMLKRHIYNAKSNSPIINTLYNKNELSNSSQKNSPNNRLNFKSEKIFNNMTNNIYSSKKQMISSVEKGKKNNNNENEDLFYLEIKDKNPNLKLYIDNNTLIDIKEGKKYIFDEIFLENQENELISNFIRFKKCIIELNLNICKEQENSFFSENGLLHKIILTFLSNQENINCKFIIINNEKIIDLFKDNNELLFNNKIEIQNISCFIINKQNLNEILNPKIQILKDTYVIFQILNNKEEKNITFVIHQNNYINEKIMKFLNNNPISIIHFFSTSNFNKIIQYLDKSMIKNLKIQEKTSLNIVTTKGKINQPSFSPPSIPRIINESTFPIQKIDSKENMLNNLIEENKKLIEENQKYKKALNNIREEILSLKEFLSIKPNELLIQENNKLIDINKKLNDSAHSYIQKIENIAYELNNLDSKVYTFDDNGSFNMSKSSIINSDKEYFKSFRKNFDNFFKDIANLPKNTLSNYSINYNYFNSLKSTFNSFNCFMDTFMNNHFQKIFEFSPNQLMKKTLEILFINLYYEKMLFELFNHSLYENRKIIFNDFLIDKLIELYTIEDNEINDKFEEIKKHLNSFNEIIEIFIDNLSKENNIKLNEFTSIIENLISNKGITNEKICEDQKEDINKNSINKDNKNISNCSSINKDSFFGYIKNEECPEMLFDEDDSNLNVDK